MAASCSGNLPAIPGHRELTLRDGESQGGNRDSPPSVRAIGFTDAQDVNKNGSTPLGGNCRDFTAVRPR